MIAAWVKNEEWERGRGPETEEILSALRDA